MQTWLVHMRRPRRLLRDLGPAGVFAFQLLLAGNVLAALVHPVFTVALCYALLMNGPLGVLGAMGGAAPLYVATLLCGYASAIVLNASGLGRRGLLRHAWVLALTPAYWFLLSFAAWRALFQLWRDPQRWEKTEHGRARTSRLANSQPIDIGRQPELHLGHDPHRNRTHVPAAPTAIIAAQRGAMLEAALRMPQ
jgi:hypothetical protein